MKKRKNTWRYYFTQVYHNWRLYDVWFPRYWAWRTKIVIIIHHFLPFYPPNNLKNQNLRYHHFKQVYQKSWSYAILFLRYDMWRMLLFLILGHFLPFYQKIRPKSRPKNQNEKKIKNIRRFIILQKCTKNLDHML